MARLRTHAAPVPRRPPAAKAPRQIPADHPAAAPVPRRPPAAKATRQIPADHPAEDQEESDVEESVGVAVGGNLKIGDEDDDVDELGLEFSGALLRRVENIKCLTFSDLVTPSPDDAVAANKLLNSLAKAIMTKGLAHFPTDTAELQECFKIMKLFSQRQTELIHDGLNKVRYGNETISFIQDNNFLAANDKNIKEMLKYIRDVVFGPENLKDAIQRFPFVITQVDDNVKHVMQYFKAGDHYLINENSNYGLYVQKKIIESLNGNQHMRAAFAPTTSNPSWYEHLVANHGILRTIHQKQCSRRETITLAVRSAVQELVNSQAPNINRETFLIDLFRTFAVFGTVECCTDAFFNIQKPFAVGWKLLDRKGGATAKLEIKKGLKKMHGNYIVNSFVPFPTMVALDGKSIFQVMGPSIISLFCLNGMRQCMRMLGQAEDLGVIDKEQLHRVSLPTFDKLLQCVLPDDYDEAEEKREANPLSRIVLIELQNKGYGNIEWGYHKKRSEQIRFYKSHCLDGNLPDCVFSFPVLVDEALSAKQDQLPVEDNLETSRLSQNAEEAIEEEF
jgi:hypothetical protein